MGVKLILAMPVFSDRLLQPPFPKACIIGADRQKCEARILSFLALLDFKSMEIGDNDGMVVIYECSGGEIDELQSSSFHLAPGNSVVRHQPTVPQISTYKRKNHKYKNTQIHKYLPCPRLFWQSVTCSYITSAD